jgi:hypothetical protein
MQGGPTEIWNRLELRCASPPGGFCEVRGLAHAGDGAIFLQAFDQMSLPGST